MDFIYVSSTCTTKTYNSLFRANKLKNSQQIQKYHKLIVDGLSANGANVQMLSIPPINRSNCKKLYVKLNDEKENHVNYTYVPIVNIPIIKNLFVTIVVFKRILFFRFRKPSFQITSDLLSISSSTGVLVVSKLFRIPNLAIVTDLPSDMSCGLLLSTFNTYLIKMFDRFFFLTKEMNSILNIHNKPFIVIEGQVDHKMLNTANFETGKYKIKVCHYAGKLDRKYGVDKLVDAFISANVKNTELHLYGVGDFEDELKSICRLWKNVKYFGSLPNDYIVKEQIKSTLLTNPRPTHDEYTKYSFPSKIMEYMASGTPTLTTRLPGIPSEYYEHMYLIEDESTIGITKCLKALLLKDTSELHLKGSRAKQFVLTFKNNLLQAKKIINFCKIDHSRL